MSYGTQPAAKRVLVVDDDPISLAISSVLLEAEGCLVIEADSGEAALSLLTSEAPAPGYVLTDLRMPGLAGPELASRMRGLAPEIRIFAMSASPPEQVEGYEVILRKPLSAESLQAAFADRSVSLSPQESGSRGCEFIDELTLERLSRAMPAAALAEVLNAFLQDTGERIAAMRKADPETVRREAHTVKGGAAMVGARQIAVTASILEEGIDQSDDRATKLDELEFQLRRAETMLKQRLHA